MESLNWENIIVGILAIGIVFWMWPGVKQTMEQSKHAEKDWPGVLIPLAAVVLFVIFLISMLAN